MISYRYGVAELFDSLFQLLSLQFQFRTPFHQFLFLLFFSCSGEQHNISVNFTAELSTLVLADV